MSKITVLVVVLALAAGLGAGFLLGRWHLERQWSQPLVEPPAKPRGSGAGPSGKILRPMPLRRSRMALSGLVHDDPVLVVVGSVGRDDSTARLQLVLKNRGRCAVASARGVAYGFDAEGAPAALGPGGDPYLPFEAQASLDPGASAEVRLPLRSVELASVALAHVDEVRCQDGSGWRRN